MISIFVYFIVKTVLVALCLWAGMKLTKVEGTFVAMLIIAAISSLVGFIPLIGWILSIIIMFVLITKLTHADLGAAFLMIVVAALVSMLGGKVLNNLILSWI